MLPDTSTPSLLLDVARRARRAELDRGVLPTARVDDSTVPSYGARGETSITRSVRHIRRIRQMIFLNCRLLSRSEPGMRQLSATDAFFLFSERNQTPNHIGMLQIYDPSEAPGGAVPISGMLANLQSRLHLARAFREKVISARLGLDFPYWIDDPDFDLEYHVRHMALPKPGTWRQLCAQASRLHSRRLDRSRPLWEMTVIEGLDGIEAVPPGSFAIYFKIHHAAIDGVAGAELLTATHASSPVQAIAAPLEPWRPEEAPSGWGLLARAGSNNLRRPVRAIRSAIPALPWQRGVLRTVASRPSLTSLSNPVPRTRFNAAVTEHRTMDARSYPLADLKAIKNAIPGSTVNDVALAVVGGALRAYLLDHDELPGSS